MVTLSPLKLPRHDLQKYYRTCLQIESSSFFVSMTLVTWRPIANCLLNGWTKSPLPGSLPGRSPGNSVFTPKQSIGGADLHENPPQNHRRHVGHVGHASAPRWIPGAVSRPFARAKDQHQHGPGLFQTSLARRHARSKPENPLDKCFDSRSGRRPSLVGWRPSILGWRLSPVGWRLLLVA